MSSRSDRRSLRRLLDLVDLAHFARVSPPVTLETFRRIHWIRETSPRDPLCNTRIALRRLRAFARRDLGVAITLEPRFDEPWVIEFDAYTLADRAGAALRPLLAEDEATPFVTKTERQARYAELRARGCEEEFAGMILDLEESCDALHPLDHRNLNEVAGLGEET